MVIYRSSTVLAFIGGLIAALLLVLIVILLNRDGDSGDAGTSPTTSGTTEATTSTTASTTSVASTTTAPPTTTSTTASTTTTTTTIPPNVAACDPVIPAFVAAGAVDITTALGDVDGDGLADTVTVYRDGAVSWYIHVQLGFGFGIQAPLEPFNPGGTPYVDDGVTLGVAAEVARPGEQGGDGRGASCRPLGHGITFS